MNFAEVYIEPLFVGGLTIVMIAIPFQCELASIIEGTGLLDSQELVTGATIVGLAYLIGTIVDRFIDTCLEDLERHNRARFAYCVEKRPQTPSSDPYPEDRYRVSVMAAEGKAADWLGSLRTRLRLMRAAAFTLPGITFGAALVFFAARFSQPRVAEYGGYVLIAAYAAVPSIRSIFRCKYGRADRWSPPRTDSPKLERYATVRGIAQRGDRSKNLFMDVALNPFILVAATLILVAVAMTVATRNVPAIAGIAFGGLLSAASGWAWWRTSGTFMTYVWLFGKELEKQQT
jgi:hypothetical protein